MHPLLEAAKAGDERARSRLVLLVYDNTRQYIERRMGARVRRVASADDLTQEVLARVFRSLESLPEDADLDTFRGRVGKVIRWVISEQVSEAADFRGESSVERRWSTGSRDRRADESSGRVTNTDRDRWLRMLARRLPERYADVILLRMEGVDFKEIAARLEEREGAVRKRYQRAVVELRRILSGEGA